LSHNISTSRFSNQIRTLKKYLLILALISVIGNILFVGVYCDWSDGDLSMFIKKKPALRLYYWSPEKFYRFHPQELTPLENKTEIDYIEFCEGYEQRRGLNGIPILWLQFSISLIMVLLVSSSAFIVKFLAHFLLSLWVVPIAIVCALSEAKLLQSSILLLIGLVISFYIMKLLEYKSK
jgi:hypothetical protein